MMEFNEIFLIVAAIIVSALFTWVAWKDNGKFDKKEIVQLFLILASIYALYNIKDFGLGGLAIILGSLIISVGMRVFKLLANGNKK